MNRYFYIVNLRYAPGNWQHMESFANCLQNRGYPLRFLISSGYQWMNHKFTEVSDYVAYSQGKKSGFHDTLKVMLDVITILGYRWYQILKIFQNNPPAALLLVSWHPLNFFLVSLIRARYPGTPIISWMHEPYKEEKKVYGKKAIIIHLVELFQTISLPFIGTVILHSRRGLRLFSTRYPNFHGINRMIPLQFLDYGAPDNKDRKYISFLGRADKAKGSELFFDLIKSCAQEIVEWKFQIVTHSNIQGYINTLSPQAYESLKIVNKDKISDGELSVAAAQSLAVVALYKETTQSGIIPVALMNGTPVIGTNIEGITEWIEHKKTGVIVSPNPSLQEIKEAINFIQEHFEEMTANCRNYYLSTFDDGNWLKEYGWVMKLMQEHPRYRTEKS